MNNKQYYKNEIIEFLTSRWDYISMFDAIKEINQSAYKGIFSIGELKSIYKEIEEYSY